MAAKTNSNTPNIDSMRARDLRKLLYKLGHDRNELKKVIDKTELRKLARESLSEQEVEEAAKEFRSKAWKAAMIAGGLGVIYIMYAPVLAILYGLKDWFRGQSYQTTLRMKLIRKSIEHRYLLATLALILATVIDIMQPTAHFSIMLSWMIPHNSKWRRFLLPMPNFPITLNSVLGLRSAGGAAPAATNSKGLSGSAGGISGWSHNMGEYGLNVAPMVMMWIAGWLKKVLEEYGASKLFDDARERNKRKEDRNNMKATRAQEGVGEGAAMSGYDGSSHPADGGLDGHPPRQDPFLSRPVAARGPPPPDLPFADPMSNTRSKGPGIVRLHFSQPVQFDEAGATGPTNGTGADGQSSGVDVSWNQSAVDDGDFWDDVNDDSAAGGGEPVYD
jgi:hypothetical protein